MMNLIFMMCLRETYEWEIQKNLLLMSLNDVSIIESFHVIGFER